MIFSMNYFKMLNKFLNSSISKQRMYVTQFLPDFLDVTTTNCSKSNENSDNMVKQVEIHNSCFEKHDHEIILNLSRFFQ